jgi:hypothetical protein
MTAVALELRPPLSQNLDHLPVAIIGAGPVGLAAAAQLAERGIGFVVLEAGPSAGTAVAAWGHTRLFSPWEYLVDAAAGRLLDRAGWDSPRATRMPFGRDLVSDYLLPLAGTAELSPHLRFNTRVSDVSRQGMDRTRSANRASTPFLLRVTSNGIPGEILARAVIDSSGTYGSPNGLTASGLGPVRSDLLHSYVSPALPDVLGVDRDQFAGKHTLVVGAGHSAANTLLALATLAHDAPGTSITWSIRGASPVRVYGSDADELQGRGRLGSETHNLVRRGAVALVDHFEIDDLAPAGNGTVAVVGRRSGLPTRITADRVVNATGFRPDLSMLREIRLSLDEIVEAPRALAPMIDPNLHSCGSVPPHGVVELAHPEPNFYIAGIKSYGRAPTFLLATGYEQVRSIADEIAGNRVAARQVRLLLPETGVCSTVAQVESGDAGDTGDVGVRGDSGDTDDARACGARSGGSCC